ncbi:MAG: cell envelope integrity protein CreD, partial [Campylobacter sp.]|nr:cell envelope integrity protein CreD [Campylobacter sp.]
NIRYDTIDNRESVDIIFISPINNYSLALRCVTYAILFLAVPFLAIFLCEIYSGSRIHMIQYLLIGAADVLFYLLILSISEHLSFLLSYLIASIAVCGTILFYGAAIFRASKWGVFIALVHAVSYCILYGILQSEDYALLMGSVMIFAVIVLVMYLTRKIDWYESKINF